MNRKGFLSLIGLSAAMGLSAFIARKAGITHQNVAISKTDCGEMITPPVNEGPFYKDEKLNRHDITEGKEGIAIMYVFKVQDSHCNPISHAVVDIWQCDKDGTYSDFSQENTERKTWLRGMQTTGYDGSCSFKSIFPGWYDGRITHLHGKVHYKGETRQTTNFFFPKSVEETVFKNSLYAKGQNPVSIEEDVELRGDINRFNALTMKVTDDGNGGYVAHYTFSLT